MTASKWEISLPAAGSGARIVVDGVDITDTVSAINIRAAATEITRIEVEHPAVIVEMTAEAPRGVICLPVPLELADQLVDDDECVFDHHGGCQTHHLAEGTETAGCPMAQLRALLERARGDQP